MWVLYTHTTHTDTHIDTQSAPHAHTDPHTGNQGIGDTHTVEQGEALGLLVVAKSAEGRRWTAGEQKLSGPCMQAWLQYSCPCLYGMYTSVDRLLGEPCMLLCPWLSLYVCAVLALLYL